MLHPSRNRIAASLAAIALVSALGACTTVGPDFEAPTADAPANWTDWRSGDESLRIPVSDQQLLPADWWTAFNDPVLDQLERRAFAASPDLRTAALHFAQSRVQAGISRTQGLPQVAADASAMAQRQSEYGAATRLFDSLSTDRDALAEIIGEPYGLYQAGFDVSWELDLWGKVSRQIEAADANVANQGALLELTHLTLASDVAQSYFDLRSVQRQVAIAGDDVRLLGEKVELLQARTEGGVNSYLDLERQRTELQAAEARLPPLLAREGEIMNRIALLTGDRPGTLSGLLGPVANALPATLPNLSLGLPSEFALRRPDIRAAEARLHEATAKIGVAKADLYPSIRLVGSAGLESYEASNFFNLASGTFGIGPSISLPIFDGGRLKRTVELRELEQQEAAVDYQKTVLQAWQEIDNALNNYAAGKQEYEQLAAREASTRDAFELVTARYEGGVANWLDVADAQRNWLQARRELADSESRVAKAYVMVNKATGNTPPPPGTPAN